MSITPTNRHHSPTAIAYPATRGILKLPDDVLSGVFLNMVEEEAHDMLAQTIDDPSSGYDPPTCPWTLAAVCGRWRIVCLENSRMWSFINLAWQCQKLGTQENIDRSLLRTQLQIERSRQAPLFVNAGIEYKELRSHWTAIFANSHHWEEVHLGYDETEVVEELISEGNNSGFANLRRLTILNNTWGEYLWLSFPIYCNDRFKNLRSLTLQGVAPGEIPEITGFPWAGITSLNVQGYSDFVGLVPIIAKCTELRHLDLSLEDDALDFEIFVGIHDSGNEDLLGTHLPHLNSLTVTDQNHNAVTALGFLRTPSLRCLKLNYVEEACWFSTIDWHQLNELEIHYVGTKAELREALLSMTQLQSLTFSGNSSHLLPLLSERNPGTTSKPGICPSLTHLKVYYNPLEFGIMELITLLESRITSDSPLKSLHIVDDSWANWEDFMKQCTFVRKILRSYIDDGLELRFLCPDHRYDDETSKADPAYRDPNDFIAPVVPKIDRLHRNLHWQF